MVNQPAWGTDRIKLLAYEIQNRRTKRGRELSEQEVEEKKEEKRDLEARREKAKEGAKAKRKLETKITAEADRVIASTETAVRQGTATLERRFDRMEANLASRSSGRDELLERLLGQPGSSREMEAELVVRKENIKRKRREEREEDKQAEKRRKWNSSSRSRSRRATRCRTAWCCAATWAAGKCTACRPSRTSPSAGSAAASWKSARRPRFSWIP